MARRFIGQAIHFRHGQTEYTDIFPDLTPQGEETIKTTANTIRGIIRCKRIILRHSPSIRAFGSIFVVSRVLGRNGIVEAPNLASVGLRNRDKAIAIFKECSSGSTSVERAYSSDVRYDDPAVFEPRKEVRQRFYKDLALMAVQFSASSEPICAISSSHYELLYHYVESIFGFDFRVDLTLGHGEIIDTRIFDIGIEGRVELEVHFRERVVSAGFNPLRAVFAEIP